MPKTGGKRRLPLPESFELALGNLGLVPFENPSGTPNYGPHAFVLRAAPKFILEATASNIPGESAVTAQWPGQRPTRFEVDPLIRILEAEIARVTHPSKLRTDLLLDQILGPAS